MDIEEIIMWKWFPPHLFNKSKKLIFLGEKSILTPINSLPHNPDF